MITIRPFRALRPPPSSAGDISSVPYDVVTTEEARRAAEGNPLSFLHVIRSEIDMPDGTDPYDGAVYRRALANLNTLREKGILFEEQEPSFYVYRLAEDGRGQTGLACCCSVDDYDRNIIKKHEHTRKEKEDDRLKHILTLGADAEPVLLAYRGSEALNALLERETRGAPLYDFTSEDGVRNTLWRAKGAGEIARAFGAIPALYIADGHHRAAAASRALQALGGGHGDAESAFFLAVIFPSEQLRILPYNRYVSGLNGMGAREFLQAVKKRFCVRAAGAPGVAGTASRQESSAVEPGPAEKGVFGMYLEGRWYELRLAEGGATGRDPVAALDLTIFHERLLRPLLGILEQKNDKRIDFAGGYGSAEKLRARVDAEGGVAFTFCPVSLDELLAVADAGLIMPPKSTWFWPKLRSGLLVHLF